jgi:uroporphyrinogen decarboxylase
MTHKERFFATVARADVDRPACWLGLPTSDAVPGLLRHFKVKSIDELKKKIGNDFGSQNGLMLSPDLLRELVFPGTKKLIDQAHSYGLKVIHHSCGAVAEIIPDLIELGVDVIHPIQALATGMEPQNLKSRFGGKVSFCGGVDAQNLLVNGSPEELASKVRELCEIFPTGLIISPSHEAILPDIPPANIEALFKSFSSRDF